MKVDFKKYLDKFKEFWKKLSAMNKKVIFAIGSGTLVLLIAIFAFIAISKNGYRVLFPGMTNEESTQVYATLQEMNVQPKIDSNGQIMVPQEQWDDLVFQLNARGYPKTALSYDTFSNAAGFTATEFEKKTALIFQSQDRMQQTLLRQKGIEDATVNFAVPESSNYIWDESNKQESSANVTILMKPGYTLDPERVSAIKHLAATSIPKLKPENVVVVDASTGMEALGVEESGSAGHYNVKRLEFEEQIENSIEEKVVRLLSGKYGPGGVTAVATVEIDYDKMMSESKEYHPREDGKAGGVINHIDESYSINGTVPAQGIVGEEDNTDAPPLYQNIDGEGEDASLTDFQKSIDYDVSYVLTQVEKGEPILKEASVAVVVNDAEFDVQKEEMLVNLISKAVNIGTDNIKVTNLNFAVQEASVPAADAAGLSKKQILIISLAGLFVLIAIVLTVLLLLRRKKKKQTEEEEAALLQEQEEEQRQLALQREIEEHKRTLQNEAMAQATTKESAIADEVRDFAQHNPEITASLIRSLLREEQ